MARSVVVDAGFLVALLNRRDRHQAWAAALALEVPPPWKSCEAALSEAFHLLGVHGRHALAELLRRQAVTVVFELDHELARVLDLVEKYVNMPMGLADACLVRMTETLPEPLLLTTDGDFRVYRRHGRQAIPSRLPS